MRLINQIQVFKDGGRTSWDSMSKKDKRNYIINFYVKRGFSPIQAAAIAGNIEIESGFDTRILGDNGTALGLFQHRLDRRDKLESSYSDPFHVDSQLEFAYQEIMESPWKDEFLNSTDLTHATNLFTSKFERPNEKYAYRDRRIKAAQEAMTEFDPNYQPPQFTNQAGQGATPTLTLDELNRISPADIWEMYKDEPTKAAELIAFKNEYEERLKKEAQEEKQAEVDLQKQALAQAQAEKQMVQKLLTTPTTPQEDYNAQIAQSQQPTQPFRFQTDWYIPQMAQRGGTVNNNSSELKGKKGEYPGKFKGEYLGNFKAKLLQRNQQEGEIENNQDFIKDIKFLMDLPSYPFQEANTKKTIQDSFDFFDGWINSPIYSKIVKERYPSDYKQKQINRLNKSNIDLVGSVSKRGPGYINGIFIPKEGNQNVKNITYTKPDGEIDDYTVNKKYLYNFSEDVSRIGKLDNIYLENLSFPYMSTHELSHSITEGNKGLTYNDIKEIGQRTNKKPLDYTYGINNITNEYIDYLRDPTEVQARINSSRHFLRDKKLYDPYKEKFTKEHLKKIKENIEEYKDSNLYDLFRSVNSDDDFIWLMNNIVYNEKQANTNTFIAQQGGTISPLQRIKQKFQQQ